MLVLTGLTFATAFCLALGASAQVEWIGARASEPVEAVQTPAPQYGTISQSVQHVSITDFRGTNSTYSLGVVNTGTI
jgi:hypothetical protein